jgi:hypothetical protein
VYFLVEATAFCRASLHADHSKSSARNGKTIKASLSLVSRCETRRNSMTLSRGSTIRTGPVFFALEVFMTGNFTLGDRR